MGELFNEEEYNKLLEDGICVNNLCFDKTGKKLFLQGKGAMFKMDMTRVNTFEYFRTKKTFINVSSNNQNAIFCSKFSDNLYVGF